MSVTVNAVGRTDVPDLRLPDRFHHDVIYFAVHPSDLGQASLPPDEYCFVLTQVAEVLEDGVFSIISPLDSDNRTELELLEDHEVFLAWLVKYSVERVRLK